MQGPLGVYSPNLDPLTALGIEARSEAERRHMAELQVRFEGRRIQQLLVYQRAYDAAWQRLYPNLSPFAASPAADAASASALPNQTSPQRLAVFVREGCDACDKRVRELQAAGHPMDIYLVGSRQDDQRVRQWAARAGIDPAKVPRSITLNHDGGRWVSLGAEGSLPAVMVETDGQWRRQ